MLGYNLRTFSLCAGNSGKLWSQLPDASQMLCSLSTVRRAEQGYKRLRRNTQKENEKEKSGLAREVEKNETDRTRSIIYSKANIH